MNELTIMQREVCTVLLCTAISIIVIKSVKLILYEAYKNMNDLDDEVQKSISKNDYQINRVDYIIAILCAYWISSLAVSPAEGYQIADIFYFLVIAVVLLIATISDIKIRYSPDVLPIICMVVAFLSLVSGRMELCESIIGMMFPGVFFLLICGIFPSFMGGADIKFLIVLGCLLGIYEVTSLYVLSCIVLAVLYLPFWFYHKVIKKDEQRIFVPALSGFFIAFMLSQYGDWMLKLFAVN